MLHAFLLMGIWDSHWGQQGCKKTPRPKTKHKQWNNHRPSLLNTDSSGILHLIPVIWITPKRFILAVPQIFPTSLLVIFVIINPVPITSKLSAENKSKGLSEAFVLISSASNSLPTSKLPITSSSPRAEDENRRDLQHKPLSTIWKHLEIYLRCS